jgi:hypothetical protein
VQNLNQTRKSPDRAGLLTRISFDCVTSQVSIVSLRELCNLVHKSRNLATRGVSVNDPALCRAHQFRFRTRHCLHCSVTIAALDGIFDEADGAAHLRATRLVDHGAAGNLSRRLLGGSCIGHG